jgi:hypothetical protein
MEWDGAIDTEHAVGHSMKHRLFMAVLIAAIGLAMTGWVYALGWVALKLIQFV